MAIAFFDLDKTLIAENSAKLWLMRQWQTKQISVFNMIKASFWLTKYSLGFSNLEEMMDKSLDLVKGYCHKNIVSQTHEFYHQSIKHLYRPQALKTIDEHRKKGDVIALLTSGFDELTMLVQKDLNIDYRLCSNLEIDKEGYYTGKSIGPLCFGKNKILYAQNLCQNLKTSLDNCVFYTDSASDLPMLCAVGKAVVVNPDLRLRQIAKNKKWPIVDWGRP
jgi:HAD superfamily hydrolase (TIGR01490 family)